jgi:predicted transcriptional regulator of viral defense system
MTDSLSTHNLITPKSAKSMGMSKHKFYKFVKDNNLERVDRGIYVSQDEWIDELSIIHKRCPQAVFSHDEAFYYHDLVDREPFVHTFTIYSGFNVHRLKKSYNIKAYSVKKELLDVGKIMVADNFGNEVPMYNLERTICDAIRSRNSIELNIFSSILKSYVRRSDKNLNLLMEYAKLFRVQSIAYKYLVVML